MERRYFLKTLILGFMGVGFSKEVFAEILKKPFNVPPEDYNNHIKDYLFKMRHFDRPHKDDVYLSQKECGFLKSSLKRLKRIQMTVGHGNFCLLNFDQAIKVARNYSQIGRFSKAELDFFEMIFYKDSSRYGFFDVKPLKNVTDRISRREVIKISATGSYLYKGPSLETYKQIKRDVGNIFLLFLNKAYKNKGNLSVASRSLAPPGYSFHGVGDFDVGQVGLGVDNFTRRFLKTKAYRRLKDLDYINLRYLKTNMLGVRFEPWHIKVISNNYSGT
ncbi:MAG: M15 family metallopeptidase [Deltaproteobacteria bacterium]|nr:M15 family metallopeptidase [Deltaproteobacteria bacterium]